MPEFPPISVPKSVPELTRLFSETALEFAGHPNDEDRAFMWLTSLRQRKIGLAEALAQAKEYLELRGANEVHIMRQLNKVSEHLRPWLLD